MAVKLDFLQPGPYARNLADNQYLYKDLKLDLQTEYVNAPGLLREGNYNDLAALYDGDAITQSLYNIFNTQPGQKLLNPEFGLDLNGFIFNRATVRSGYALGVLLTKQIPELEPRVNVKNIDVVVDTEDQSYIVDIYYTIPTLETTKSKVLNIKTIFNTNGFTII